MGQYYKGEKIGTCDTMYYMRLGRAKQLAELGARDDDKIAFSDYLKDNVTKWRFAFPDEDTHDTVQQNRWAHDKTFMLPAGGVEVSHDTITIHNEHKKGGHGINIFVPCPHSKEFNIKMSSGGAGEQFVGVLFQAMRDHIGGDGKIVRKEKTIFQCARCGAMQRFSDEDIEKIKARTKEYFEVYNMKDKNPTYKGDQARYDYAMEVINRIK